MKPDLIIQFFQMGESYRAQEDFKKFAFFLYTVYIDVYAYVYVICDIANMICICIRISRT